MPEFPVPRVMRLCGFLLLTLLTLLSPAVGNTANEVGEAEGVEQDWDPHHYTHQWAAHIVGGKSVADGIARKHGFINIGEVS